MVMIFVITSIDSGVWASLGLNDDRPEYAVTAVEAIEEATAYQRLFANEGRFEDIVFPNTLTATLVPLEEENVSVVENIVSLRISIT